MHSILIVEDDMNINGLLKEALEKADYLCTQAFSGTEARMLLAMNRYSVVSILIVEDDMNINGLLKEALEKADYLCTQAFSGTEARMLLAMNRYSVVLLDLMLPGISGEEVLQEIRKQGNTPVIILTAKDTIDDKVEVLQRGADDYVTKPFDIKEVLARVSVQIRRMEGSFSEGNLVYQGLELDRENLGADDYVTKPFDIKEVLARVSVQIRRMEGSFSEGNLVYQGLELDRENFCVRVDQTELPKITRQEFAILELLLKYPKKVFSKEEIFEYAWEEAYMGETKPLDVHISNIRKKIKSVTSKEYIETIWGIGYRLHP